MTTTASTSTAISASAERVWGLLTDRGWWEASDNGVLRLEGTILEGRRVLVVCEDAPDRGSELGVTEIHAPATMLWTGGLPLGLCTGRRTFQVEAAGDTCSFSMVEDVTGPLSPLVVRVLPDLQTSFDRFALALKTDSEVVRGC
jgi:hypothetical protein